MACRGGHLFRPYGLDSNAHAGDKAKGAVTIDALPGLGKTTSVLAFAKQVGNGAGRRVSLALSDPVIDAATLTVTLLRGDTITIEAFTG